jgi:hypothetical protein
MQRMYAALLVLHSLLRWVVLLAGLAAAVRGIAGWSRQSWTPPDARAGRIFVAALDLQLLVGLVLYGFLIAAATETVSSVGEVMRDSNRRFFFVEHPFGMLAALALAHVGQSRIRKATDPLRRHRTAAVFFGLSLVVMLLSIPWPGMPAGRPLWPW